MATAFNVLKGLMTQIQTVIPVLSPPLAIGIGWPSEISLQRVAKQNQPVSCVYDQGMPRNRSRWPATTVGTADTMVAAGISAVLSLPSIKKTGTATITISGTPVTNDNVGFTAAGQVPITLNAAGTAFSTQAASYTALVTDTLATIAAGLAAAINANMTNCTATSVGAVVTVTALASVTVAVATANQGLRVQEFGRVERGIAFHLWSHSEAARQAIGDPVSGLLRQLEASYGFTLSNGEWVHVQYEGDRYIDDDTHSDMFRRSFFTRCEYGEGVSEILYPVTAVELSLQAGQG